MINDFWKNPKVKNYLVCDIFNIDEVVRCYGGCPNDEDYKIVRTYYYWEWQGDENHIPITTTKEDYEKYKDSEEENYRTEINYIEFENVFWFNEFADFLINTIEPDEQLNFISYVNETFNNASFEGQAKVFLKEVFSSLKSFREDLEVLSNKRDRKGLEKINKIQDFVINHYSGSYKNTIDKLSKYYESIYPELIQEFIKSEVETINDNENPNIVDIEGVRKFNMEIPEDALDFLIYITKNDKYYWIFTSSILQQVKKVNYSEYLKQLRTEDFIFLRSRLEMSECFEIFIKDLHFDNIFYKYLIENKIDSDTVKKQKIDNLLDGLTKIIYYFWNSSGIFEIIYAIEEKDPEFHNKLRDDDLFIYLLPQYQCYENLKNIYDLIMNDYVSFVDLTKYKFDYFYSNKENKTKNIDEVPKANIEKTSKKRKEQKTIFEFIHNILDKDKFLNELKNTFPNEKGKSIKAIIDYLQAENIFIIQVGDYSNFVTVLKEYFDRNIGEYSAIQNVKHIDNLKKAPIEQKLEPLVTKYKTTQ